MRKSFQKRSIASVVALTVLVSLTACSSQKAANPTSSDEPAPVTVSIGASGFAGFASVYEMESSDTGSLTVDIVNFSTSSERGIALLNNNIDMALLGWTQVVQLAAQGMPVVVIASNFEDGRTIVAREGSDIKNVADLVGKTVAYSVGSMVELDLNYELQEAGLKIDDLNAVNMGFSDMVPALANGDLDAFLGSEPQSSSSIASGSSYLVKYPYDAPYGAVNGALVTTEKYLSENRATVELFLSSYVGATDKLNEDTERLTALVSEMTAVTDQDVLDLTLSNLSLVYGLDGYQTKVEALAEAQMELKMIESVPDYASFVDASILEGLSR